jgi:hypothetical protein
VSALVSIRDDAVELLGKELRLPYPRAYQLLFVALLGLLLVYPVIAELGVVLGLTELFVGLVLMTAALAGSSTGEQFRNTMLIAAVGLLFGFVGYFLEGTTRAASRVYGFFFLCWITWQVLHDVLMVGRRVNTHIIYGALCAYLLLGMVFAFAFSALHAFRPDAIDGVRLADEHAAPFTEYAYFAFSSMTTLGIGDVVPLSPMARALTYLAAVMGQIYLTVIVARLVALYSADALQRHRD